MLFPRLWRAPAAAPPDRDTVVATLRSEVSTLTERVAAMERAEALRAAEHAAALDKLERLYKRMTARFTREAKTNGHRDDDGESVLSLRQRLGR